jgi:hypothetical protein
VERSLLLLLLLCCCVPAAGQLVIVDAGQGMTGEPSGGIVGVNFGNWEVDGSLGMYNGSVVGGGVIKGQLSRRWSLKAGDQNIELGIPTETSFSAQILARGGALNYSPNPATQITFFAGMAGGGYSSTNILYFDPQIPLGVVSIDHYLDHKKRFLLFTHAMFSNQQTVLGGFLYQSTRLHAGFAAGTGSNQPHAEATLRYFDKQWDVREGYLYSGNRFQLLTMRQLRLVQEDGENADVRWHPWKEAIFSMSRHAYLSPPASASSASTRGSTDMGGGTLFIHGMGVGGDVYESRYEGQYGSAASFYASEMPTKKVHLSENYYRPLHSAKPVPMLVFNVEENLNRRLMLTEFITHVNKQWNLNYGGNLHWDRFSVNLGYTTDFIPLVAGGGRFQQSMNLEGHVDIGRWSFGMRTYVQPDGSLLYSYEVKSFYFHPTASGVVQAPSSGSSMDFPSFLIAGQVVLEDTGKPVADVPVRIGNDTVYADETGAYSLRVTHKKLYKIQLLLERPIGFHYYEQVSGSAEVMAGTDQLPGQAQFVVRVSQKKVLSAPNGGIVIGHADATVDGASKSGQNDGQSTPAGTTLQTPGHEPSDPTNLRR